MKSVVLCLPPNVLTLSAGHGLQAINITSFHVKLVRLSQQPNNSWTQPLFCSGEGYGVANSPNLPEDALHVALKGLEPLERERVLQFMKGLEDAEARLAKLRSNTPKKASSLRSTLQNYIATQQEMAELKATVNGLKRTYEKVIKKTVRNPEVLNVVGERLLGLMRELGVPP